MSESASYMSICNCNAMAREIISAPWSLFNNTFPFTFYLSHPLPSLRKNPFPFAGPRITALRDVLTLAMIIVFAISRTAPSTT